MRSQAAVQPAERKAEDSVQRGPWRGTTRAPGDGELERSGQPSGGRWGAGVSRRRLLPLAAAATSRTCRPGLRLRVCTAALDCAPDLSPPRNAQAQLAAIPKRLGPKGLAGEDAAAVAAAAQQGFDAKLAELRQAGKRLYDRVYYGDVLPPIGSYQISYARCAGRT